MWRRDSKRGEPCAKAAMAAITDAGQLRRPLLHDFVQANDRPSCQHTRP